MQTGCSAGSRDGVFPSGAKSIESWGCTGVCQRWLMAVPKLTWCENQSHRWPFLFLKWWWWSALSREVSPSPRPFSVSVCLMIQRQEKEWGHKITVNKTRAQNGGKRSANYRAEEKIWLSDSLKTSVKPKKKNPTTSNRNKACSFQISVSTGIGWIGDQSVKNWLLGSR